MSGSYCTTIDDRCRLRVPSALQPLFGDRVLLVPGPSRSLLLYPPDHAEALKRHLPADMAAGMVILPLPRYGRVTVPQPERRRLGLKPGCEVVTATQGQSAVVMTSEDWDLRVVRAAELFWAHWLQQSGHPCAAR